MPRFTGSAAAREKEPRTSNNGDVWLKKLRAGNTKVRLCQEPLGSGDDGENAWAVWEEHYHPTLKYFPCAKNGKKDSPEHCLGCDDLMLVKDDGNPKTSLVYAFNALDDNNRLNIFKVTYTIYEKLRNRQQRVGSVMDRDFVLVREGTGFGSTKYDVDVEDKYDRELPDQIYDIEALVAKQYDEAVEAHATGRAPGATNDEGDADAGPEPQERPAPAEDGPRTRPAEEEAAETAAAADPAPAPATSALNFEDMSTNELRTHLTRISVEFPKTAPRSKLIQIAEENPPY